ncbi:CheW domain protein [Ancylobacter novellus DSM 506]|uniref:CheW domain protein n=1 Tax=Ancylobacter novellus (strain ATCC 8093 / DSM 506 / JCM 20403 / CCM 1077 / IAM 12100 / NBRC 12443 / NCIMB 10456) TaxID=639283 RepID=D7A4M3_ANCN5|nr:chemotaxis protein CheW [Ancylobacter novellus]ADH89886.1 CheW domain protein [Ancylobacter novellus DSM 506]
MVPVDTHSAALRGPVPGDVAGEGPLAALAARSFRALTAQPARASSAEPRPAPVREEMLVFSLRGMRFALPAAQVVEVMTVAGERWQRLVAMSAAGTLGASGLPLIRLSARMGLAVPPSVQGGLVLFGSNGKVRATVLIDDLPARQRAAVEAMPSSWRDRFSPCDDMIGGIAVLPDGAQAAILDLSIGVATPRMEATAAEAHDTAHLLVRAGRAQPEAVRIAALRGATLLDEMPGVALFPSLRRGARVLLHLGEDEAVAVDEVIGLAPRGRIERVGGLRFLATDAGRYRLLEPADAAPASAPLRVLVTAPEGAARAGMRELVRAMGHDVSLADDPRAARLAGGRFDVILVDLDAYADIRDAGVEATDAARRIGFAKDGVAVPQGFHRVVSASDEVALILALLQR